MTDTSFLDSVNLPPGAKLGYIAPKFRTQAQHFAHNQAVSRMCAFTLPAPTVSKGVKVVLTDLWSDPLIVADTGSIFTGFHQLTGSCVGASEGNAVATLSFVQRKLATTPTKAMIPWWPYPYGRTRFNEGDSGQGEGAVDSVMGDTLMKEGVFDIAQPGLPKFKTDDGFYLTEQLEYQWSDGASIATTWLELGKQHPLLGHAALYNVNDIKAAVLNGYPVLDGCEQFVGNGSITGSGDTAYVVGAYDGQGGHSTCILGYWEHPNDGPLYLYSNQWPTSTYPKDPAGAGRCCVWIPESEMVKLFQLGGGNGETMALSHLNWFPAQPQVLDLWMF